MVTAAPLRRSLATAFVALALTAGVSLADAAPAEAASPAKPCSASVSVKNPRQWTTTVVNVSRVGANAKVTTRAKYKTTTNTKQAKASTRGTAAVKYPIAGATPGRTVRVDITAVSGKTTWQCSTSFTPRHK
ncbi:hypothetical protein EAE32_02670 [Kocuria tytonicola]|uniref:Uncharacterized protein n=1 Tax=Kocuria tytonicola TaxID=2055946 RepID=A0A3L9L636_9MICC|nr:hypothetical protein [Kocuria tytonicola]RLY94145.1 hypothetical protein EAE32_02670 [Kocuria tytonicola]